jgi:hypothetical protein
MRQRNHVLMAELNPALAAATPPMPPTPNYNSAPPVPPMGGQEPYAEEVDEVDELDGGDYDYSVGDSEEDMVSMQEPPQMSMHHQQPVQKSGNMVRILTMIGLVVVVAIAGFLIYSTLIKDKDKDKEKDHKRIIIEQKDENNIKKDDGIKHPTIPVHQNQVNNNTQTKEQTSTKKETTGSKQSATTKDENNKANSVFDKIKKDQSANEKTKDVIKGTQTKTKNGNDQKPPILPDNATQKKNPTIQDISNL